MLQTAYWLKWSKCGKYKKAESPLSLVCHPYPCYFLSSLSVLSLSFCLWPLFFLGGAIDLFLVQKINAFQHLCQPSKVKSINFMLDWEWLIQSDISAPPSVKWWWNLKNFAFAKMQTWYMYLYLPVGTCIVTWIEAWQGFLLPQTGR